MECYNSMWLDALCVTEGYGFPGNSTLADLAYLDTMGIT